MPAHDDLAAAKISALAGLLAGIAAIAVVCIFLIFALPSIGRPGKVCGKGCVQEDQYHPLGSGGRAEGASAAAGWNGRGHRRSRDCPGAGTGRFKIIDYSKAAWTIEDLSDYLDYLISTGHLKVLSLDYSISRIALKCGEEYRLLPRDALHSACCKAYGIEEMATNDSDFKRVSFLTLWKP